MAKDIDQALAAGCVGIKIRGVIKEPDVEGILGLVMQHFEVATGILDKGLVPMMQIKVESDKQAACEKILCQQLLSKMRQLREKDRIIFVFGPPANPETYASLVLHEKTLAVYAMSSAMSCDETCEVLANNKGMSAALSKALRDGLTSTQTEQAFGDTIEETLSKLFRASSKLGNTAGKAGSKAKSKAKASDAK